MRPRVPGHPAGPTIALLYPGDADLRARADPHESRFAALFAAFDAAGVHAEPVVWHPEAADAVLAQLSRADAVLAWCNPIEGGHRRDRLDAVLRKVADRGAIVSAHPDAVIRLGTKDVLLATRDLPFGSDVHRIDSLVQLQAELPERLARGPRVLKQHRGHSGIGVWRIERGPGTELRVRHAQRGSVEEGIGLPALAERLAPYFTPEAGGHMIDQAWQPRIAEGMVRAYLVEDRVAGFGTQAINALHPDEPSPGPRIYHGPDRPDLAGLRERLESDWIEQLRDRAGLTRDRLPLLWDCDFMLGEPRADDPRPYVLCEINVSSVSPFPESAIGPLVAATLRRVAEPGAAAA